MLAAVSSNRVESFVGRDGVSGRPSVIAEPSSSPSPDVVIELAVGRDRDIDIRRRPVLAALLSRAWD